MITEVFAGFSGCPIGERIALLCAKRRAYPPKLL